MLTEQAGDHRPPNRLSVPEQVYVMVRGHHQDEISLMKLAELLSGNGCAGSSRAIHLVDTVTLAEASLEISDVRLIRSGGVIERVGVVELPPDSLTLTAEE